MGVSVFIQSWSGEGVGVGLTMPDDNVVNSCTVLPGPGFISEVNDRLPRVADEYTLLLDGTAIPEEGWWESARGRFAMGADAVAFRVRNQFFPGVGISEAGSAWRTESLRDIGGLDERLVGFEWAARLADTAGALGLIIAILGGDEDAHLVPYPHEDRERVRGERYYDQIKDQNTLKLLRSES